jgi:class 3 adenylate cyclase
MEDLTDSVVVTRTPESWLKEVKTLERRGELLSAYDVASHGLAEHPNNPWLKHRAVLALARAGATETARRQYAHLGLEKYDDEDIAALDARLDKDTALLAQGPERTSLAEQAADKYEKIYRRTHGYYPAINAATLKLLAWKIPQANALAREVLGILAGKIGSTDEDTYYRAATEAEAHLILRDEERAAEALGRALQTKGVDLAARAVTRRQLRLVGELTGADLSLLNLFETPRVIHFCGHIISPPGKGGRFPAEREKEVAQQIADYLEHGNVGFGYGSLASGADILFAEALLDRHAELHVVLPFNADEFLETSVRPAAGNWERRFRHCLGQANAISFATQDSYLGDDRLFSYCSSFAMGLAILRARYLDGDVAQVAVWDGEEPQGEVGTAADVTAWQRLGLPQTILPVPGLVAGLRSSPTPPPDSGRKLRAMLFGDVKGFSKLTDRQLPTFVHDVLGAMADALRPYEESICFRNTWGDGIFLVLDDVRSAASCALDLQAAIASLGLTQLGMPSTLALRLGGHYGPVYEDTDPIVGATNYFGAHVSRAARIEPITPEGSVYVTEPFAAILALDARPKFACDYVGSVPAAKGYGVLPMYLLRRKAD